LRYEATLTIDGMNYTQGPIGLYGVDSCDFVGGEEDSVFAS
jgi:hypothetical protein